MYHISSYLKCLLYEMHLKNALTVLIAVTNLLLGSLCCSVIKLKVGYQWTDTCKLRYFKYLQYFTLPMCIVNLFKS